MSDGWELCEGCELAPLPFSLKAGIDGVFRFVNDSVKVIHACSPVMER